LLGGVVLLFIIAPLAGIFIKSSGTILLETVNDKEVQNSVWLTLSVSFLATLFFAFFSIPLAFLLARNNFKGKQIVLGIIDLPIVIPHSAAGIAVLGIISRDSFLGSFAENFGFSFVGKPLGIGLAMAFVSVPFLLNSARDGFAAVPERMEKVAYTLGASNTRTFFTVSLPLAKRNILSGFILMFARGMSEFGAVIIIAYHPTVTPILIYDRFSSYGIDYAGAASVIFILVSLVFFVILRLVSKEKKYN
jgi:molybdate/tungstate transport system permease protein